MNKVKNAAQAGFTLIELIVVIVILGILAATALPKFANLGGDARAATIQAAAGSVNSVIAMTHGQSLAGSKSIDAVNGTVQLEEVALKFDVSTGYPKADATLLTAAGLNATDYGISVDAAATPNTASIYPKSMETLDSSSKVVVPAGCKVVYTAASRNSTTGVITAPSVVTTVSSCS